MQSLPPWQLPWPDARFGGLRRKRAWGWREGGEKEGGGHGDGDLRFGPAVGEPVGAARGEKGGGVERRGMRMERGEKGCVCLCV